MPDRRLCGFRRAAVARLLSTACAALLGFTADSCLIEDDRCGPNQVKATNGLYACVCEPGYVTSALGYGCDACGENEESMGDKCVCKAGFNRSSDTAPCEAAQGSELGSACSESDPCVAPNDFCALSEDEPYCTTQGCKRNDDCPANWRCDTSGDEGFCNRPPSGFGDPCQSSADCAGKEASYCESLMTHVCIVNNCLPAPEDCPSQNVCCDVSAFVPGASLCVAISALSDGKCPGGSTPVTP